MAFFDMVLIGVGLAADAFAAAVVRGLAMGRLRLPPALATALVFGFFQGAMTLLGYFAGTLFASRLQEWGRFGGALLLFFLGGRAMADALRGGAATPASGGLVAMGLATSVDASAVGVALSLGGTEGIFYLCVIVGIVTFLLSLFGVLLGCFFGVRFRKLSQILGALILIAMGIRFLAG